MKNIRKIPVLIFIVVAILFATGISFASYFSKIVKKINPVAVAGEDEGEEDKSGDGEEEKDEDKDKDKDENDEKDEDSKRIKNTTKVKNDDDDEDENENKLKDEKDDDDIDENGVEDDDENEVVTKNTVTNAGGTTTETITKTEEDETKVTVITRDASGKILEIKITETKTEDGKQETETKVYTYDASGKLISKKINGTDTEDENENEDIDEVEHGGEAVAKNTVTNPDGTTTETTTITEDDETKVIVITRDASGRILERKVTETDLEDGKEETKTTTYTYDANGNLLEKKVAKTETENGKTETKTTTYDIYGKKLSEIKIKTVDGKMLKVKVKDGSEVTKAKYNQEEEEMEVEIEDDDADDIDEVEPEKIAKIKVEGKNFKVSHMGYGVSANFPMEVDNETGKIYVVTPNGKVELKSMPDVIFAKARAKYGMDTVEKMEIKVKKNKVVYEIAGQKEDRFLGVFKVKIKTTLNFNPETGGYLSKSQSFWGSILDFFSV